MQVISGETSTADIKRLSDPSINPSGEVDDQMVLTYHAYIVNLLN